MLIRRAFYYLLVIYSINVPGFMKFDATALERTHEGTNAQHLARVGLFLFIAIGYAFFFLVLPAIRRKGRINWPNFLGLKVIIALFLTYFITATLQLSGSELLLSYFRQAEWILAIFLIASVFTDKNLTLNDVNELMIRVLKTTTLFIVIIVSIAAILFPDIALLGGSTTEARLGGQVYHPHIVGLCGAVGAILFWYFPKSSFDKFIALFMVFALVLSKSRTDLILFLLSIALISVFTIDKNKHKFFLKWLVIISSIVAFILLGGFILEFTRMNKIEEVTSLNSRLIVWLAAIQLFPQYWATGMGYVAGVSHLGDFVTIGYYHPRHADSDIITSFLSGGVLTGVLTIILYAKLVIEILTTRLQNCHKVIYLAITLHLAISAIFISVTSWVVGMHGIILLLMLRHVAYLKWQQNKIRCK